MLNEGRIEFGRRAAQQPMSARAVIGLVRRLAYPAVMGIGVGLYAGLLRAGVAVQLGGYTAVGVGVSLILLLEALLPHRRGWRADGRETRTDIAYLVVVQVLLPMVLALGAANLVRRLGGVAAGGGWPRAWPLACQFGLLLVAADFLRYWLHRAAHQWEPLWRLHAVHHAPAKLYARNVSRFHLLERALQYLAETLPFALLGAGEPVLTLYLVSHALHGFLQHANIDVRLGALNYVVSGPELHRWHHSRIPAESNANYANHLTLWDLLFGSYSLPAGRQVDALGLLDPDYPTGFATQLCAPFRRTARGSGPALGWREIWLNRLIRLHMRLLRWQRWRPMVAAAAQPRAVQLAVLRRIVSRHRRTRFGRAHGFAAISSVDDYRRRVPPQTYESLRPYIESQAGNGQRALTTDRPILYAQTSGTTGAPHCFPITRAALAQQRRDQQLFAYAQHRAAPGAYDGRILAIVSPAVEGHMANGTPIGSVSGCLYQSMPWVARRKYVVPAEVFDLTDHEIKYRLILRLALAEPAITAMGTANPSTFLQLLERLRRHRAELLADLEGERFAAAADLPEHVRRAIAPRLRCSRRRLAELRHALAREPVSYAALWPHLRLVSTWTGGSCGIALARLRALLPAEARVLELGYLASELRGTVSAEGDADRGVPALWETFFEFVEKERWERGEREFRLLDELERGREYYVFATTATGLYRYGINDIVRVTGRFAATPTIAFVQKGAGVTSITGEKLYEGQVIEAVRQAEAELGAASRFFLALADVPGAAYRLLIESDATFAPDAQAFGARVDRLLGERNIEYRGKRASGRLGPLVVCLMREGFGDAYRTWCVGRGQREGQFKALVLQYATDCGFDSAAYRQEAA
jgi:sterol desaturase/sphingolipid hydroxylase (fatty acid hydroxylase superfamily)